MAYLDQFRLGVSEKEEVFVPKSGIGLTAGDFVTKFANDNSDEFFGAHPGSYGHWIDEKANKGADTDHSSTYF